VAPELDNVMNAPRRLQASMPQGQCTEAKCYISLGTPFLKSLQSNEFILFQKT